MAFSAYGQFDLPGEMDLTIENEEITNKDQNLLDRAKKVVDEMFESTYLSPGTYNVRLSGHPSEGEDDLGDNLMISVNRTAR
jgi:hypothetical protein